MKLELFKIWLDQENGSDFRTIQSRMSNCRTVENHEGDLDEHFIKDNGLSLLDRLSYSTDDERNQVPTKHKVPINGNFRTGSACFQLNAIIKHIDINEMMEWRHERKCRFCWSNWYRTRNSSG